MLNILPHGPTCPLDLIIRCNNFIKINKIDHIITVLIRLLGFFWRPRASIVGSGNL